MFDFSSELKDIDVALPAVYHEIDCDIPSNVITESLARGLASRTMREVRHLSKITMPVGEKQRSRRRGAFVKYIKRIMASRFVLQMKESKKSIHVTLLESAESCDQLVVIDLYIDLKTQRVVSANEAMRLTHHFLARYIQRTAKERKNAGLTMVELKSLCNKLWVYAMDHLVINGDTFLSGGQVPEDESVLAAVACNGFVPVTMETSVFNETVGCSCAPVLVLLTYIDEPSLGPRKVELFKSASEAFARRLVEYADSLGLDSEDIELMSEYAGEM